MAWGGQGASSGSSSMLAKSGDAESTTTSTLQPQVAEGFHLMDTSPTTPVGAEGSTRGISRSRDRGKPREVADSPLMSEPGSQFEADPANLGSLGEDKKKKTTQDTQVALGGGAGAGSDAPSGASAMGGGVSLSDVGLAGIGLADVGGMFSGQENSPGLAGFAGNDSISDGMAGFGGDDAGVSGNSGDGQSDGGNAGDGSGDGGDSGGGDSGGAGVSDGGGW